MNEKNSSLERALCAIYKHPAPSAAFLNTLEQDLLARLGSRAAGRNLQPERSRTPNTIRRRLLFAAAGLLLVMMIFIAAVGPDRVLASFQWLIGYLPGVGFVQDTGTVRVLQAPVSISREGVTITVNEVVADIETTRIMMRVTGIRNLQQLAQEGVDEPTGPVRLSLQDGTDLDLKGYSLDFSNVQQLAVDLIYGPMPRDSMEAVLSFSQIPGIPSGAAPEDWSVHLSLVPGSHNRRISPAAPLTVTGDEAQGISITLESFAQVGTRTAIRARLNTPIELGEPDWKWASSLRLIGPGGRIVPFLTGPEYDSHHANLVTFETTNLMPGETYTLNLNGPIELVRAVEAGPGSQFTFDPGPDPRPGQSWSLDQTLRASEFRIHLVGVHLASNHRDETYRLIFSFEKQPGVSGLMVHPIGDHPETIRSGPGPLKPWVEFVEIPNEPIQFQLGPIFVPVEGSWEVSWVVPDHGDR